MQFELPDFEEKESSWGPPSEIPSNFRELPFAPFSKRDHINVVADWYNSTYSRSQGPRWGDDQAVLGQTQGAEDVETGFVLNTRTNFQAKQGWRNRQAHKDTVKKQKQRVADKRQKQRRNAPAQTAREKKYKKKRMQRRWRPENPRPSKWVVDVQSHWVEKRNFYISNFYEFTCSLIERPETLLTCGEIRPIRAQKFGNVTPHTPLKLLPKKYHNFKHFGSKSTVEDPIMKQLFDEEAGNIYVTDLVLAALMNTFRSRYSFDVVASKRDGNITFDVRPQKGGKWTDLELLHVDETSAKRPNNKVNSTATNNYATLAQEATRIQGVFREQALEPNRGRRFERPNPFLSQVGDAEVGSQAYVYRRFVLPDDIRVVCRGTIMATYPGSNRGDASELANVYALNQYDPRKSQTRDWKSEIDTAATEIMFDELRNNSFRCGRWAVESFLADVDRVQFGFIARAENAKNTSHQIVYARTLSSKEFLKEAAVNLDNCWGVFKMYVDCLREMDDGRYVFLRQPLKNVMNLFSVADDEYQLGWLDR